MCRGMPSPTFYSFQINQIRMLHLLSKFSITFKGRRFSSSGIPVFGRIAEFLAVSAADNKRIRLVRMI